jgi:DNA-binding FadR family transcriptional regulator
MVIAVNAIRDWRDIPQATQLSHQLYELLTKLIQEGEFVAGIRLPAENRLAEPIGVSRPVVREALERLRMMGMVVSRKGSGSFNRKRRVSVLIMAGNSLSQAESMAQVRICHEFRVGLEGEAAHRAPQNSMKQSARPRARFKEACIASRGSGTCRNGTSEVHCG